jgi:hypothetical protein
MAGTDPESGDPMDRATALRAVEEEPIETALEIGFHVEEFEPEHLRVDRERVGAVEAAGDRLVDERVGLRGLLGDDANRPLEELTLPEALQAVMRRRLRLTTARSHCGIGALRIVSI